MRVILSAALVLSACSNAQQAQREAVAEGNAEAQEAKVAPPPTPAAQPPSGNVSQFTTDGLEKCKLVEKNEEEGSYYRHLCPGIAGFSYEVVESDLRQSLVIIAPDGTRSDVSPGQATGSGGFSSLGPTFDWRGPAGAPPRTVTVRFIVNEDPEPNVPPRSYLVVIRLAAPACAVGVVPPGAGQNERARAIADGKSLKCLPQA